MTVPALPTTGTRVTTVRVVTALVTLMAIVFTCAAFAGLPGAYAAVPSESWWWLLPAAVCAAAVYPARALGLLQAADLPLPFGRTALLTGSESFTTMATPGGVGTFALTVRYLQCAGLDVPAATSSATLASLAASVVELGAIVVALPFTLGVFDAANLNHAHPRAWVLVAVVLGVALVLTLAWHVPRLRSRALPALRRGWQYGRDLLRQPGRAVRLIGAEALVPAAQSACLACTLALMDHQTSVAVLVLLTQLANLAQRAVPIPGALGAPEAVLVAGLEASGLPAADVVAAALTYRVLTYWLPPLPGVFGLRVLHRRGAV